MLNKLITPLKNAWLDSNQCSIKNLLTYIKTTNQLRNPQIQAIEVYLFLKIKGKNKPLWQLFSEGFFNQDRPADNYLEKGLYQHNKPAFFLYKFAQKENITTLIKAIEQNNNLGCTNIIKRIFYRVSYSDYLLSLPMGAGKTYLMAAFIYLDLHFALNEPHNKNFAHNFLILIPHALKNSITPSLKTITHFDGSWVLPKSQADKIKKLIKFDILDEAKNTKKSSIIINPNALKVNNVLPNPFGQIFVVNAEKVIIEQTADEKNPLIIAGKNELKDKLSQVPNMSILIDEVHHATDSDIKLRTVVNEWNQTRNITTVLGFSGTPYLKKLEKINLGNEIIKFSYISNTVYYYPLTEAIKSFLKMPIVKSANLEKTQILKEAITEFNQLYKNTVYENGTIAKCAIYCSNIANLEEVVYPYLVGTLNIPKQQILKFHKGNATHTIPSENQLKFNSLDLPSSQKRYILLVQIGKEGWDCRSLTSVILSGTGDSPKNMVLQTSCRCLREVDKKQRKALIWLNEQNAQVLNKELKKQQHTSIDEINQLSRDEKNPIKRHDRSAYLKLPKVNFYQLKITYTTINIENNPNTKEKLQAIIKQIKTYKKLATITTGTLEHIKIKAEIKSNIIGGYLSFNDWLFMLIKNSFNTLNFDNLLPFKKQLKNIYDSISQNNHLNELVDLSRLNNDIALAFSIKRQLNNRTETIKKNTSILLVDKLTAVADHPKLYPNQTIINHILAADNNEVDDNKHEQERQQEMTELAKQGKYDEVAKLAQTTQDEVSLEFKSRDKTFHYLPYDFKQSSFEKDTLASILVLDIFQNSTLEIYYNGQRGLTDFVIDCYEKVAKNYRLIGKYTPDFLIIKRNKTHQIAKILIVETKGEGYANDNNFIKRKKFVSGEFIKQNNEKFGYRRFDFLYLEDTQTPTENLKKAQDSINHFFN